MNTTIPCHDIAAGALPDAAAVRTLAALAHPARLAILRQLSFRDACCCKDIVSCLDLAQSTVSQHLKILVEAGLVDYRPERQTSRYSLNAGAFARASSFVQDLAGFCCRRNTQAE